VSVLFLPRTIVAFLVIGTIAGVVAARLDFSDAAYLAVGLVGMFLVSLTDREGFYGDRPLGPPRIHR
jgi:hypothetical protein